MVSFFLRTVLYMINGLLLRLEPVSVILHPAKTFGRKHNHMDSLGRKPCFVDSSLGRKQEIVDSISQAKHDRQSRHR